MSWPTTRVYRVMVTVTVEGDSTSLPSLHEMTEEVATLVQDEDDHNFQVCVRAIETQDFKGCGALNVPPTHGSRGMEDA